VSNYALGEDFMAYGYPEDVYGPDPQRATPRLFKGTTSGSSDIEATWATATPLLN
jgi:hypothetical protein